MGFLMEPFWSQWACRSWLKINRKDTMSQETLPEIQVATEDLKSRFHRTRGRTSLPITVLFR